MSLEVLKRNRNLVLNYDPDSDNPKVLVMAIECIGRKELLRIINEAINDYQIN